MYRARAFCNEPVVPALSGIKRAIIVAFRFLCKLALIEFGANVDKMILVKQLHSLASERLKGVLFVGLWTSAS